MNRRRSGFSIHAGDLIAADDQDGWKALVEYILQLCLLALRKQYPNPYGRKEVIADEDP
jgi:hypothetical protein